MLTAWCLAYLGVVVLTGYVLTIAIFGTARRSIAEITGLVMLLGAGGTGTLLLGLSLLGLPPMRTTILLLGLADFGLIYFFRLRGRLAFPARPQTERSVINIVLAGVIIVGLVSANLLALMSALGMPMFMWDAFVIWSFKAKVLYFSALTPRPEYFTDVRLSFSHLDYPLLLPMLTAGAFATVGNVDDQLGKLVLPVLFAGQTLIAYTGARLWLGRVGALLAALLLIGAPFNILFSGLGNADFILETFRLGAVVYLIRWIGQKERSDIRIAALFSFFAAMTKSEGMALSFIDAMVALLFAARAQAWKDYATFIGILVIGIGIWVLWRAGIPHTDENYAGRLSWTNLKDGVGRLGMIFQAMWHCLSDFYTWGGIWILLPLMLLLGFRALVKPQAWALWMLLLLHTALYIMIYMITPVDLAELLPVTVERLTLHMLPTAMLLIAIHWSVLKPPVPEIPRAFEPIITPMQPVTR